MMSKTTLTFICESCKCIYSKKSPSRVSYWITLEVILKNKTLDEKQFQRLPSMPPKQHVYCFSIQRLHYLASSPQQHNQPGEVDPEIKTNDSEQCR